MGQCTFQLQGIDYEKTNFFLTNKATQLVPVNVNGFVHIPISIFTSIFYENTVKRHFIKS